MMVQKTLLPILLKMGITSLKPKPQENFLLILIPYHQLLLETKELIIKIKFNIT